MGNVMSKRLAAGMVGRRRKLSLADLSGGERPSSSMADELSEASHERSEFSHEQPSLISSMSTFRSDSSSTLLDEPKKGGRRERKKKKHKLKVHEELAQITLLSAIKYNGVFVKKG